VGDWVRFGGLGGEFGEFGGFGGGFRREFSRASIMDLLIHGFIMRCFFDFESSS
jgi:hypothetical protein